MNLPFSAYVTVQIGCDNSCAFCIVPSVRGKETSRPFGDIVSEVEELAAKGITEITLLGQNVNSYGRDLVIMARRSDQYSSEILGHRYLQNGGKGVAPLFSELLRAVSEVPGIRRVRFTSPHPKDLRPETIDVMAQVEQVVNHLHFPLQSGSDDVLKVMHRGYTSARYLEKLIAARTAIEDLAVSTDIIVGFPGETEDDFTNTLEVVAQAQFDAAFTFIYSPRPGTQAAMWTDRFISPEVIRDRFDRLKLVTERSALLKHQERVGRIEEVIVEGPSKRDPEVLSGRTRQNKLVHFSKDGVLTNSSERLGAGSFANVHIESAAPYFLRGSLLEVTQSPRHKRSFSVVSSQSL